MSQADILLDRLSENYETEGHVVIGRDRFITVPEELWRIAVQHDHNIERVTFDCPRYWDDNDMSTMNIYINYKLPNNTYSFSIAENVTVDEEDSDIIHFDWVISRDATLFAGQLIFLVCAKTVDDEGNENLHWNSETNDEMFISEGMVCCEAVLEPYPDVVTQLLMASERANNISKTLEDHMKNGDFELGLPIVDANDNGRILRVENGEWCADELRVYEGGTAYETNNSVFIRYSANADGSDFTENWTPGQCYIGIATTLVAPVYASAYKWVKMIAPLDQNVYGNAFVGNKSGEIVELTDVSRIPHTMSVKVTGENINPSTVTLTIAENGSTYKPDANGNCDVQSISPTMTIHSDTEGAIIDVTYNRDSNIVLDFIEKNVITATATLKENGAYTLRLDKGVKT